MLRCSTRRARSPSPSGRAPRRKAQPATRPNTAAPSRSAALLGVEGGEDLATQILRDVALATLPEPTHGASMVAHRPKPEGREVDRRRPALGPFHENVHIAVLASQRTSNDQQLASLRPCESKLAGPACECPAVLKSRSQPDLRIVASQQDQTPVGRKPLDRVPERGKAFSVRHGMGSYRGPVPARARERRRPVHQLVDGDLHGHAGHSQSFQRATPEALADTVHGGGGVSPQPSWIVVVAVQRHPRPRGRARGAPDTNGGCLAVPRGRRDQRQRGIGAGVERVEGAGARRAPRVVVARRAWPPPGAAARRATPATQPSRPGSRPRRPA